MRCPWLLLLWTFLLSGCSRLGTTESSIESDSSTVAAVVHDESDDYFSSGKVAQLKIEVSEEAANSLRENPRAYVKATLIEKEGKVFAEVGVKLKGAAGSFRDLDDRPAFTLHAGKFKKKQRFHALEKFHLNNSVQDETLLSEALCGELCREAGVPAGRVAHARVWLNDRNLGLYVLREGFDEPFLMRHFSKATGNLYDGGFCTDLDQELEKDSGNGPDDRSDLAALKAACEVEGAEERAAAIEQVLDVDAFLSFMALELMMGHWDGYTANKNNYRIYFDPTTNKARFIAHGMDQMFQDPDFPAMQFPASIVGSAVMGIPSWRQRYIARVKELLPNFAAKKLAAKVERLDAPLQKFLGLQGDEAATHHSAVVVGFQERLTARAAKLREQVGHSDAEPRQPPEPIAFNAEGAFDLSEWNPHEPGDNRFEVIEAEEGRRWEIAVGESGHCLSSWRQPVLLRRGKYRFEAQMKTEGVEAISDDKGSGAGLRISGANRERGLDRNSELQEVNYEFEVGEEMSEVVLVAELRATKGKMVLVTPARLRKVE